MGHLSSPGTLHLSERTAHSPSAEAKGQVVRGKTGKFFLRGPYGREPSWIASPTSLADVLRHLDVLDRVEKGLLDVEAGRVVPHDPVERRLRAK